jgi:hypothetical protein
MNVSQEMKVMPAVMPTEAATTLEDAKWEVYLRKAVIFFGRIALAYLFFTQLWWKLPPSFGCPSNFAFKEETSPGQYTKSSGLCTWLGYESIFAAKERQVLVAELNYAGGPKIALDIGPLARLNGAIVDNIIKPNIRWTGYVIWLAEAFIVVTMLLGLFTRLGGLVALGVSGQLFVGLANVAIPGDYEWEWAYLLMIVLSVMMIGLTSGRILGIDSLIRRALAPAVQRGSRLAKLVTALT